MIVALILGFFVLFIVVLNLMMVIHLSIADITNEHSTFSYFYQKWENVLEPLDSKIGRFLAKAFYFLPTIIAFFSQHKHSNE